METHGGYDSDVQRDEETVWLLLLWIAVITIVNTVTKMLGCFFFVTTRLQSISMGLDIWRGREALRSTG